VFTAHIPTGRPRTSDACRRDDARDARHREDGVLPPLRERYQIAPGQDDALVLAIAIVIDQMAHATR
jgi:hypothetical protein